ncbi:hypothetical protein BO70DRAFT_388777 [Aspergillus heteromorphus CBS 117.55]|uniref:Uncharacterized protein n=1 Tax=Aspergillus heteromorphus CBS 117.55 TaxID=1448321 RepID=A0A317VNN9_9EURO|nr:uncharacterized protein BO70DRAFT_388777 [Aspergillus heteromorphus CBS 117.55]PWY75545.1 hypothetical protein BO70DRAFT_388777 [Aspergillus heteromorphus CBS 117.55]
MSVDKSITRNGFCSSNGRFCTVRGSMERIDGRSLRRMFLPKLTSEGQRALRNHPDFVRDQLQHYAVEFHPRHFSGNGTLLLKQVLEAGKCDTVPRHILALQDQLHREWLNTRTPEQLSGNPEWVMDKYFLRASDRRPDRKRTTTVVGIPLPRFSQYQAKQMRDAASKVAGLHHETGVGTDSQTIFMGWDAAAVGRAARAYATKEKKGFQVEAKKQECERPKMKADYFHLPKQRANTASRKLPMDCDDMDAYLALKRDLHLDIHDTNEPGVFQACFNFEAFEGVMLYDPDDEYVGYERPNTGYKRKALAPQSSSGPKKARAGNSQSHTYHSKLRCRETNTGRIYSSAYDGYINFKDGNFASFVGEAEFPVLGPKVPFFARKISDAPCAYRKEWADYSEALYERERVRRWY